MALFNFFKQAHPSSAKNSREEIKQPNNKVMVKAENKNEPVTNNPHGNFVDGLVNYFESEPQITRAYFGFMYNNNTKSQHLFLAVEHNGDEASVKQMTWFIKSAHIPDTNLHFATNVGDNHLFEYIKQHNFPFYDKDNHNLLQQKIMKQWFDEKYKQEMINTLKQSEVITLVKDLNKTGNILNFQTYIRDSGEFIPLFSDEEMIAKSGMTEMPKNLTIMKFAFGKLNEVLENQLNHQFFILNPGTPFEVEFIA